MRKWLAIFVLPAAALAWFVLRDRHPAAKLAKPPTGVLAVFPFDAREAPQYAWLADGMVDLLARDLEDSQLRTVEASSVLNASRGLTVVDPEHARSASLQAGANFFALGSIAVRGGDLSIEATLYGSGSNDPLIKASARGKPDELLRLVQTLSDQLQLRTRDGFDTRLAELTRRTSASPAALQAWLEGERMLRGGQWLSPPAALERAVAADPEFAFAHYRLGVLLLEVSSGEAEDVLQRALRHPDRLSPSERGLAQVFLVLVRGSLTEAQRLYEAQTRNYPADVESWMRLAEFRFHLGPVLGRSPQEAVDALNQVLALDPLNTEATVHLADLAEVRGDTAETQRLADRVLELADDPGNVLAFRLLRAWARGDAAAHAASMASVRVSGHTRSELLNGMMQTAWEMNDSSDPLELAQAAPFEDWLHPVATVALLHGRPELARRTLAAAIAQHPAGDVTYFLPWVDTLDLMKVSPGQLARSRAAASHLDETKDSARAPAKRYLMGMLAVRAGDFAAAASEVATLEKMPPLGGSSITTDLALALQARILAARKDFVGALALLDKQLLRIPMRFRLRYGYFRPAENLLRASLLEELNRGAEALPLYEAFDFYAQTSLAYLPVATLHRARIYEKLGDTRKAIERYEAFAVMWKECEPEERGLLEEARTRLVDLRAHASR